MKYQVSKSQTYNIRQEMKHQVYIVQQPKLKQPFKKHHRETTKREKRRGKRRRKRKKPHREILPPRWRIFGGAPHRLVAQTSRWSIALSSSGTCEKKDL